MTNQQNDSYFSAEADAWLTSSYEKLTSVANIRLEVIRKLLSENNFKSILDLGCGDGRFLCSFPGVKTRVGLDSSEEMLAKARIKDNIQWVKSDLDDLSTYANFSSLGKFDIVTMMGLIHYIKRPKWLVSSLSAVCNPGSVLVVSFRNALYNIVAGSKYEISPLTRFRKEQFDSEARIWSEYNSLSLSSDRDLGLKDLYFKLFQDNPGFCASLTQPEGVTDSYWNPFDLPEWRQFTPYEALTLMLQSGFNPIRIIPLLPSPQDGNFSAPNLLPRCTSFVIVASA